MKLSKIVSCLVPLATIGVSTPILTSCGNNSLVFIFGDSINCLSQEKEYTDVAAYRSYDEVYAAVKKHVKGVEPAKDVSIYTLNEAKEFQPIYWDFIAGKLMNNYIIYSNNILNETGTSFGTFKFEYKLKDDESDEPFSFEETEVDINDFNYIGDDDGKVCIKLRTNDPVQSYIYQNCKAKD